MCPAPVVLHPDHRAKVEVFYKLRREAGEPAHRKVGASAHRPAMLAKQQGGNDAAVFRAELCNHVASQRAVLGQPVQQDQDGTIPDRIFVLYGPRR